MSDSPEVGSALAKPHKNNGAGYFRLLFATGLSRKDYFLLFVGIISAIGAGVPFPLLGILFGQLVNDLDSSSCTTSSESSLGLPSAITQKVLLVIYVSIANFVLIYVHTSCWSLVGEHTVRRLRKRYLSALLRQELAFFDTLPSGEVASRLDVDLSAIQTGTSEKVGLVISSVSYFVAAYIVAFLKAPRLAGMLFSIVPAFLLMALGGGYLGKRYSSRASSHIAKATGIASAGLLNMTIVHSFNANARLESLFIGHLNRAQADGLKKVLVNSLQLGSLYLIAYSANALAFWQGSIEIAQSISNGGSEASVGGVYTVIFVLVDASFIISQVAPFLQLFGTAAAAYGELATTINRVSEIDGTSKNEGKIVNAIKGTIELRNVSFSYSSRPDVEILHDFSLTIPANKHTAIVGLSGSGKSTIAALIGRLYDPNNGEVLLDGENMRGLNVKSMRRFIGTVAQDSSLFDRSVLENIAHGLVNSPAPEHIELQNQLIDSSLHDLVKKVQNGENFDRCVARSGARVQQIVNLVKKAASDANALTFIEDFSYGLATSVGSCGGQLSGGQKQRIVLARALIREPKILILDEATAALDSLSEQIVQEALEKVTQSHRTTITIAHRLSTIKNADNIVVMRDGRILEEGSRTELLERNGAFADMVSLQSVGIESASGASRTSLETLVDSSKGHRIDKVEGILLSKDEDLKKTEINKGRTRISMFLYSFSMARPYLGFVLLGIAAALVVGGSYSGEALIFGHTVGDLSSCNAPSEIKSKGALYGLLFFVLALVEFSANFISTASFGRVAENLLRRIRIMLLHFLFRQDLEWHESEGRTPSNLLSYVSSDANNLAGLTGTILGVVLSILVNVIAGIVLAHIIAWKIAVVLLSMIPVLLLSGFLRLQIQANFHVRHQKAFAHSVGLATEAVTSMKTISSFSLEAEALHVYERSLHGPYAATLRSITFGNFWLAIAYSISNLVYALAYWWGAKQIVNGTYTPQQFFTVLPALLFSAQSGGQLLSLAPDVSKATVAASRVFGLLNGKDSSEVDPSSIMDEKNSRGDDLEAAKEVSSEKLTPGSRGVNVCFKDVYFSYPARPDIPVLQGLDLSIKSGQFCALVGQSGAGKSTVISLLERFYTPSSGSITVDGRDISKTKGVSFRDDIALVPQESTLFEGTLRFNLEIGARPGTTPSQDDIEAACRLANIHDTITALPEGYETPCGPNGNQFSGGQMQRMAIARALLRKPRLLLLDESTSALDAESESLLQGALERATRTTTVIAIAHRMHTIKKADCIFVIEGGRCTDRGSHEELCERSPSYRANALHQSL
jgi:ATP-binding cassette subfamily B (MDR/TAP) protein 1